MGRSRSKRTTKENSKSVDDLNEEQRKKFDTILEDFDKEVENRIQDERVFIETLKSQIESMYKVAAFQLPVAVRKMKASEYFNDGDSNPLPLTQALEAARQAINTHVETTVKASTKQRTRGRNKSSVSSSKSSITESAVRRSTRKRVQSKKSSEVGMPAGKGGIVASTPLPGHFAPPLATPLITPKFNTTKGFSRTAFRHAKPNETLVSLSGSPVTTTTRRNSKATKHVDIPLGRGNTLLLPLEGPDEGEEESIQLDQEAKEKLKGLRSHIDKLLMSRN